MRALAHTEGLPAPKRAAFWLQRLAEFVHRGPRDTWTAARARAAKDAGVPESMARRIWHRCEDMKDVGGEWLLRLMLAYEAMCEKRDAAASKAAQIEELRNEHEQVKAEIERLTARLAVVGSKEAGGSLPPGGEASSQVGRSAHG